MTPLVVDVDQSLQVSAMAALSLGMVCLGTGDDDVAQCIIATLEERQSSAVATLDNPVSTFFALALGLVFFRRPDGKAANAAFLRMRAARSPARHSTAPEQSSPLVQEVAHMFSKSGIAPRPLPHWLDRSSPMPPAPPPTARE